MLGKIVSDIQKTAQLVQEISAACEEQNTGVGQIQKAIQQLDMVIQQNVSASEEMSSTSEELSSQAMQLRDTMSFFNIGETTKTIRRERTAPKKPVHKPLMIDGKQIRQIAEQHSVALQDKHGHTDFEQY